MTKTKRVEKRKRQGVLPALLRLLIVLFVADLILLFTLFASKPEENRDVSQYSTASDPSGLAGQLAAQMKEDGDYQDVTVSDTSDLSGQLTALAEEDGDYQPLAQNPENYPEELLELAVKNSEALQFVLDYPEHGNDPVADTIQELEAETIPHLFQWDERWGYSKYGEHLLAISGCGPTCLSMVASGLTGDASITPSAVAQYAQDHGYYVSGSGSSWSLMSEGSSHFGLSASELPLDEAVMKDALNAGKPIICSVREGDFTTSGHFIVIVRVEDGQFRVYDPNSQTLSDRLWDYETLASQIRNLWAFELA